MCSKKYLIGLIIGSIFVFLYPNRVLAVDIVINEFMPNADQEWVEFYNRGEETLNLSQFYFDDDMDFNSDSGSSDKVQPHGYLEQGQECYLNLSTYLNNDEDNPTLFNSAGVILDTYHYTNTVPNRTYARVPNGEGWLSDQAPTMGALCSDLGPFETPTSEPTTNTPIPTTTSTSAPTSTPVKTATAAPKGTGTPNSSSTPNETEISDSTGEILGIRDEINKTPQSTSSAETTKSGFPFLALFFILSGVLLIGGAIFTLLKKAKKEYNLKSANNEEIS
jgi:hypothetical protein